jgi:hypothetical protein
MRETAEASAGELVGYAVAAPDDVNQVSEPVVSSRRRLARDLSLPTQGGHQRSRGQHDLAGGGEAIPGRAR